MSIKNDDTTSKAEEAGGCRTCKKITEWVTEYKDTVTLIVTVIGVIGAIAGLFILIWQTHTLSRQTEILGNQTSLLGNQTQLQQSDYVNRTRPYLRLVEITVQDGNSSEVLDVLLELQNCGQVPATKAWLGEREGGEVGIYIGAKDLMYNESTGEFTATSKLPCMPSLSPEIPPSPPAEDSHGTSADVTITATPCWLPALNKTSLPEDQIFYPGISGNQIITVKKSSYNEAIKVVTTMQIGLKYYGEGREYYYIATLKKTVDNTWDIQPIERGN